MISKKILTVLWVTAITIRFSTAQPQALTELWAAEREFAHASETTSTKEAFLSYLSDQGVIFRRGMVNGKQFWQSAPLADDKLTWEPQYADVSAEGDLGFTTGPFKQYQSRTDANPIAEGHYLSIWKKQQGTWKVVLDGGVGHPPADLSTWERKPDNTSKPQTKSLETIKLDIGKLESSFRNSFQEKQNAAIPNYASTDIRLYRPRQPPYRKNDLPQLIAETDKKFDYKAPVKIEVAQGGDMAYTIGEVAIEITSGTNTRQLNGNYVRIWKNENALGWRLIVDMILL